MIILGKRNILGIQVDAVDYEAAADLILNAASESRSFTISALAVHGIMTGYLDEEHKYRLNNFDLITPDGQPVRFALNILYDLKLPDRVAGPILTFKVCQKAAELNLPIYLYGSKTKTLNLLIANLKSNFPNIIIAGFQPSKFRNVSPMEKREIVDDINSSGAKILLVGLGCPRQEVWVHEHKGLINMPMMAVGAAFDFHAGLLMPAPKILQEFALEWLFRLIQEPKRLWKRYLYLNPYFIWLFVLQYLKIRKYSSSNGKVPSSESLIG